MPIIPKGVKKIAAKITPRPKSLGSEASTAINSIMSDESGHHIVNDLAVDRITGEIDQEVIKKLGMLYTIKENEQAAVLNAKTKAYELYSKKFDQDVVEKYFTEAKFTSDDIEPGADDLLPAIKKKVYAELNIIKDNTFNAKEQEGGESPNILIKDVPDEVFDLTLDFNPRNDFTLRRVWELEKIPESGDDKPFVTDIKTSTQRITDLRSYVDSKVLTQEDIDRFNEVTRGMRQHEALAGYSVSKADLAFPTKLKAVQFLASKLKTAIRTSSSREVASGYTEQTFPKFIHYKELDRGHFLTSSEINAIASYTNDGFSRVNEFLRSLQYSGEFSPAYNSSVKKTISSLRSAIKKMPVYRGEYIYRASKFQSAALANQDFRIGGVVVLSKGFLSCGVRAVPSFASNVGHRYPNDPVTYIARIKHKTGASAFMVSRWNASEAEVILGDSTPFRLIDGQRQKVENVQGLRHLFKPGTEILYLDLEEI